jgi:hypothetical protein
MDLKDFIKETLKQICESTVETQEYFSDENIDAIINPREIESKGDLGLIYNPMTTPMSSFFQQEKKHKDCQIRKVENINFDVVIGIEKSEDSKFGGKLSVVGLAKNKSNTSSNQSNIKFQIPCVLPNGASNHNSDGKY